MGNVTAYLLENNNILITIFATVVAAMGYMLLNKRMNYNSRMHELELRSAIIENRNSQSEEKIKKAVARVPEGVSEDEFFERLKKELLAINYIQLQDDNNPNDDNSLYKFLESHHRQALLQSSVHLREVNGMRLLSRCCPERL